MVFRRPELEKDNPSAPEPYVGPRRRLAMAQAAASGEPAEENEVKTTLRALTIAASRYVDGLSKTRRRGEGVKALRTAIAQAERVLAAEGH